MIEKLFEIEEIVALLNQEDTDNFTLIENLRERYQSGDESITFTDYGAVSPVANLTQDEMYRGRTIEKAVRDLCRQGLKGDLIRYIYALVKFYKPSVILELGTCCGFSASYMAKACSTAKIFTVEGAKEVASIAKRNIDQLGITNVTVVVGRFQDVLPDLLQRIEVLDIVLIDGHHDYAATVEYFNIIKNGFNFNFKKNLIVIFDDINWSDGMRCAWRDIVGDSDVVDFRDFGKIGVVILGESV